MSVTNHFELLKCVGEDLDILGRLFLDTKLPPGTHRDRSREIKGLLVRLFYGPWPLDLRARIRREILNGATWLVDVDLAREKSFPLPPSWIQLVEGMLRDRQIRKHLNRTVGRWIPRRRSLNFLALYHEVLEELFYLVVRKARYWHSHRGRNPSWFPLLKNDFKAEARGHAVQLEHAVRESIREQGGKQRIQLISELTTKSDASMNEFLSQISREYKIEPHDLNITLQEALKRLREPRRIIISLKYLEDFTFQEISDELELPLNWVREQHDRGMDRLYLALASSFPELSLEWEQSPLFFSALFDKNSIARTCRFGSRDFLVHVEKTPKGTLRIRVPTGPGSPRALPWKINDRAGVTNGTGQFEVKRFVGNRIFLEIDRVPALSKPITTQFSQARFGDRRPRVQSRSSDRLMNLVVRRSLSGSLVLSVEMDRQVLGGNPFPALADCAGLARYRICGRSNLLLQEGYIGLYSIKKGRVGFGLINLGPDVQEGLLEGCRIQVYPCPAPLLSARRRENSGGIRSELERSLSATDHEICRKVLREAIEFLSRGPGTEN